MPELPDVEGQRRFFERHGSGRKISGLSADATVVRNSTPQGLGRALTGRTFTRPGRIGKWLLCRTDGPTLLLHFGMGGELAAESDEHPHDRLVLRLSGEELRYRNMRKFGGIWLARDRSEEQGLTSHLGPDAQDLERDGFVALLEQRRGSLKGALMDQEFVAGLGNLTVDESLWRARLHPRRAVAGLSADEKGKLHGAIQRVLRDSVRVGCVPGRSSWLTGARRDEDPVCPRCRSRLSRSKVAGRTTFWCPRCQ